MNAPVPAHLLRALRLFGLQHETPAAPRPPFASRATGDRLAAAVRAGMRHTGDAAPAAALDALHADPHDAAAPQSRPGFLSCPVHGG